MIEVRHLTRSVKNFKLNDISFMSEDGEFLVILGPSGAGKTMLLESIAGIVPIDSGTIIINNRDVTFEPPENRNIGFVYQDFILFPHLTVRENISFGLKMRKLSKDEMDDRTEKMAELLGISHLLDRKPHTLSGGEKQRVALARALVIQPEVLLLDEPLSALDARVRKTLRDEIRRLHDRFKINTIYVTHDQIEAYVLADRIGILNEGELLELGTPQEIFQNPSHEFTAKFVGFDNIFRGYAKSENGILKINLENKIVVEAFGEKTGNVTIAFRPEDVLVSTKPISSSARNTFEGKIVDMKDEGALIRLKIDIGMPIYAVITKKSFVEMDLKSKSKVFVSFKASSVRVF